MSKQYEFTFDEHFAPVVFQEINYFRERTFITAGSAESPGRVGQRALFCSRK
jgi:hypothetical protein